MPRIIRLGVLDDHVATADGFKSKLENNPRLTVDWIANYYQDVIPYLDQQPTDVLLLDIEVSKSPDDPDHYHVLNSIPQLLEKFPELKIVVISMHNRPVLIKGVKKAGASGYILKDDIVSYENLDQILLEIVDQDSIYYSPEAEQVLKSPDKIPSLTPRQTEILSLIANNPSMNTTELAKVLFVSPSTIRNHLSDIYLALEVSNRSAAILRAQKLGLILGKK